MDDPDKIRERVLLLQRLRELAAQRNEQETVNQRRAWKLLEEKHQATTERLLAAKIRDRSRRASQG